MVNKTYKSHFRLSVFDVFSDFLICAPGSAP